MLHEHFPLLRSFQSVCRSPWSCVIFRIKLFFMIMSCQLLVQIPNRKTAPYLFSMKVYSIHSQLTDYTRQCFMSRFTTIIEGLILGFKACVKKSRVILNKFCHNFVQWIYLNSVPKVVNPCSNSITNFVQWNYLNSVPKVDTLCRTELQIPPEIPKFSDLKFLRVLFFLTH
jgi:hypothetical protein